MIEFYCLTCEAHEHVEGQERRGCEQIYKMATCGFLSVGPRHTVLYHNNIIMIVVNGKRRVKWVGFDTKLECYMVDVGITRERGC